MRTPALVLCLAVAAPAAAQETTFPATLKGHAFLPALSLVTPSADAPRDAWVSGKFTTGGRLTAPMSVSGDTGALHGKRPTGVMLPFIGQPLQGLSGYAMNKVEDGSVYVLTDNGFGSKANSPDAMLFFHKMMPDFETGKLAVNDTIFLHDPDFKVPFRIAYEGTEARYLTGSDFDPESIQMVEGEIWIGEEFGPYLIHATLDGRVLAVYPTMVAEAAVKSVDHPTISGLSVAGKDWTVPRSGGYEGMALQPGTGLLWPMFEKPLLGADGQPEGTFLRANAFDTETGTWTGASFKFQLAEGATAIGDFNFIDETRAMIIERDNGEGDPSLKCAADPAPDCFPLPAMLKRIVLIDTATVDADGFVRRIGHIDLMNIADPEGRARLTTVANPPLAGKITMPFFTIENVMRVDDTHILVGNDNNLPYSSGRALDAASDNEVLLLEVGDFLAAK